MEEAAPPVVLKVDGVQRTFGARRVPPQKGGVSFGAEGGEVVAICGANGSGKSTLLKMIAGLVRPTRGDVRLSLGGKAVTDAAGRRRAVGFAAPDLALYPELSGRENLEFFAAVRGEALKRGEADERLERVGLAGRGGDVVSAYSSGMRQRLRLAFALLGGPRVLLLDEPSLALDESGVRIVAQMIETQAQRGGLTLLATNDSREAEWAGRRIALDS